MGAGAIHVSAILEIGPQQITSALARQSEFADVVDLLQTAKHRAGDKVYLVDFAYRA